MEFNNKNTSTFNSYLKNKLGEINKGTLNQVTKDKYINQCIINIYRLNNERNDIVKIYLILEIITQYYYILKYLNSINIKDNKNLINQILPIQNSIGKMIITSIYRYVRNSLKTAEDAVHNSSNESRGTLTLEKDKLKKFMEFIKSIVPTTVGYSLNRPFTTGYGDQSQKLARESTYFLKIMENFIAAQSQIGIQPPSTILRPVTSPAPIALVSTTPVPINAFGIAKYMGLSPQNANNQIKKNCEKELTNLGLPYKQILGYGNTERYHDCKERKRGHLANAKAKIPATVIKHTIQVPIVNPLLYQGAAASGGSRKKNNKSKK